MQDLRQFLGLSCHVIWFCTAIINDEYCNSFKIYSAFALPLQSALRCVVLPFPVLLTPNSFSLAHVTVAATLLTRLNYNNSRMRTSDVKDFVKYYEHDLQIYAASNTTHTISGWLYVGSFCCLLSFPWLDSNTFVSVTY